MDIKLCRRCGLTKTHDQFSFRNKKKQTRQPYCKKCYSVINRDNYVGKRVEAIKLNNKSSRKQNREFVFDYLSSHPCIECGENDPVVLDFDHRDPKTKTKNVSYLTGNAYSLKTLQNEIDKCDVLCANCHRRKTAEQFGWTKHLKRVIESGESP